MAVRGRDDKKHYFEFEKWTLFLIAAQPGNLSKKGADKGIDGNLYFGAKGEGRAIVSVKAGDNVGVFLTFIELLRPMITEAAGAGLWQIDGFAAVPKIQIVTIEQALALRDRALRLPARVDGFKKAAREKDAGRQKALDLKLKGTAAICPADYLLLRFPARLLLWFRERDRHRHAVGR